MAINNFMGQQQQQQTQFRPGGGFNRAQQANMITYQHANNRIQEVLKSTNNPIEAIASWVELFANNEQDGAQIDTTRFKSFMYRLIVEDLVNSNLNGDYSSVQLDPSIPLYEPKYIIEKTEVIKSINPRYAAQEAPPKDNSELEDIRNNMGKLTEIVMGLANQLSAQQMQQNVQPDAPQDQTKSARDLVKPPTPSPSNQPKN